MKLLDLAKMKKVASDAKTTTFLHEKGHKMTILHSALPRIMQEQIKRLPMADGGEVKGVNKSDAPDSPTHRGRSSAGGSLRAANEGGSNKEWRMDQAKTKHYRTLDEIRSMKDQDRKFLDEGTPDGPLDVASVDDSSDAAQASAPSPTHITFNVGAPPPAPAPAAPVAPQEPLDVSPVGVPAGNAAGLIAPDQGVNAPAVVQKEATGIEQQAQVDAAKAAAALPAENEALTRRQGLQNNIDSNIAELKSHANEFSDYIRQNPINPNHYLQSMDSEQKYQTSIGLILGGLGGGGTSNLALDFLNKQIDRDVSAQQRNADNRATVWGAYEHLYGDQKIATDMATVAMNDIVANQLRIAAAQQGTTQASANMNKALGELGGKSAQLLNDAAGRLGTLRIDGGQPQTGTAKPSGGITPLLHSGAEQHYRGLQYAPKARDQMEGITRQFTQAQQADKALADIDQTFQKLSSESTVSGRIGRSINPHALAGVGGAFGTGLGAMAGGIGAIPGAGIGASIGEGAGHLIKAATNTDTNRQFDSDQTALLGYISAALKGTNIGPGQIQEVVDANSPVAGDSEKSLAKKKQNIVDFIKNHTETSLLKTWGLSNE